MLIKILKKILLTLIALSMLILSLVSWRYQGDIHHMKAEIFESNTTYPQDVYNVKWATSIGSNSIQPSTIAMKKIYFYDIAFQILDKTKVHPSQSIITRAINSKRWEPFIPNSKSSTYKLAQTLWISQNIEIKRVMNYNLKGIESLSVDYFNKSIEQLTIYEIILLEHREKPKKQLLMAINSSVEQLKNIFPKCYATLEELEVLPPFKRS